jgi:predicted CoA-binding protein
VELSVEEIRELLEKSRVIAVVGLSPRMEKPSNVVANYLRKAGYRVIPVNPQYEEIDGERCFKNLAEIPEPVDIVDIFMRAETVVPVVEEAVRIRPKAVWLQLGIVNEEAKGIADKNGILFIQNRCVKIEHYQLFGSH